LLSFIADVFGFVNLSTLLTKTAAKIPAILLIVFLLYKLLEIIIIAGCEAGKSFKWHASRYCVNIELNLIRVLKLATVYILIGLILDTLEIYKPVADWIVEALVYNITIGSITISMSRILGMILIIVVSYFLANIFKVLFGNSELVNKSLSKGFLFAINKTVGYIIIIIGFIIGFAYAGIDLGKFSLLAGALGVGIGFGLQNIVNNFISGLILLYERPVEVGDIITVGSLMGEVKSIGVRASKIRTFDGAEVVVPNGNIISNDLINWTLSDKKRRLEIKIGVEYGSNPNEVLKLLQKVAVNNDKVLVDPAPTVLFDGFGESSLDFRLLAWVHFNESLSTKSQLSIAVYDALSEANIGIPFPQIDLHIKEHLTEQPKVVTPKAPDNTPEVVNDVIEEDDE
jgi:small-conductance mechanosensitive channel